MMNVDSDNSPVKSLQYTYLCMTGINAYYQSAAIRLTANHSYSQCVYYTYSLEISMSALTGYNLCRINSKFAS